MLGLLLLAVLIVGTLVVPGSAQRFAGSRRLGSLAIRVWLAVLQQNRAQRLIDRHGVAGLRVTQTQKYRQVDKTPDGETVTAR